jgi:hypothetical protein
MNDEKPELIDTGRGYTIRYKKRLFYSSKAPEESVRRKIETLSIGEKSLIFVPSIGLGYGIVEILETMPVDCHILCVEADPILYRFALEQNALPIPANERFTLIHSFDPKDALRTLREIGVWRFRRITIVTLSAGFSLYSNLYEEMRALLDLEIQTFWKNKMTLVRLSPLWIKNIFYNLPSLPNAKNPADLRTDMPVLVAGAGPSLEKSISLIRKQRSRILLIAVDTALPILMKESIRPDYIFMLEAQIANIHDFISFRGTEIPVIADITASPQVLRAHGSLCSYFSSEFYPTRLLERLEASGLLPPKMPALGSVGIAALYGALRLTADRVFVTGLDFSYTKEKTHAKGSPLEELANISSNRLLPLSHFIYSCIKARPLISLKDKNGLPVQSDLVLASYARLVRDAVGPDIARAIDIGDSGLDLGLQKMHGEPVSDIFASSAPVESDTDSWAIKKVPEKHSVADFIDREISLLKRARAYIAELIEGKMAGYTDFNDEGKKILREVDYCFLHFPEAQPFPLFEKPYLFRLLVSVDHYIEIALRARTFCESAAFQ